MRHRAAAARRDDRGLTLIELIVALTVVLVALTVLAGVFIGSLHTLTVAKQRQSATALATRAMEQMRALPFSTLTSGLSTGDLAGDPNITGTPARLRPTGAPTVDEVLQTNTPSGTPPTCDTATTPLLPHRCPTVLDNVTYEVASYVAQVPSSDPVQYSLTTIVTWTSKATRGEPRSIIERSRAFSPNGTCAPANHPFNTPCQSQFHGSAGLTEGGVTVSGIAEGQPIVPGLDLRSAELSLPRMTTSTAVEQTISVAGATAAHSARLVGTTTENSGQQALSSTSTDPSNSDPGVPTADATIAAPLTRSGAGWTLTTAPEGSGSWRTTSRASAGTNSGCVDSAGTVIDATAQPCGASSENQTAAARVTLTPAVLAGRQLSTFSLARFSAPGAPSRAFSARFTSPRPTWCPTASGVGCVTAGAARKVGSTVVGAFPTPGSTDVLPAGFLGAVLLDGYQASAFAGSGSGAAGPLASRAGTLKTYNGAAYTTTDLGTTLTELTLPVSATATYAGGTSTQSITVTVTGEVKVTPPTVSAASCIAATCNADTGTVVADLTYELVTGTATAATFRVRLDVGALLAKSSFKGV